MGIEAWTLAIAVATAVACSLCGALLVLNREALVSEGLSHAVLPGIILAFVLIGDRSSPWLVLSAGLAGLLMIVLVHAIKRTGLVKDDASLGIVFPAMFSVGVLLASTELGGVHFHAHCIIDGNLALAPLDRWRPGGTDLGPRAAWIIGGVLVLLGIFLVTFYKELKVMIFDPGLARSMGFRPSILHLGWLALVSLTTVAAFETAGSILVVALMVTPPATAFLLSDRLGSMLAMSAALGALCAVLGFYLGLGVDVAPAGPMASISGVLFVVVLLLAPKRGLLASRRRHHARRRELHATVFLNAVARAPGRPQAEIAGMLPWDASLLDAVVRAAGREGLVTPEGEGWSLTARARQRLEDERARRLPAATRAS